MKTYKVLVYNTSRYLQWVSVQANSEEEAEEKVELHELWDKDSWLLDNEHCEVDYVETEEEEVAVDLSETTHVWINETLHKIDDGKGVFKWIVDGQTLGIIITNGFFDSRMHTKIDKTLFALLSIRPVKL
jgi:hypothetical protein